jgi:hypothetical protein
MATYQMIRGPIQKARCTNKSTWGSPLYCDCGCQVPRDTDPAINLTGVAVSRRDDRGYADYILTRDGQECGSLNTQYNYISLDGHEFLGVDLELIADLLAAARSLPQRDGVYAPTGDSLAETAAAVKMAEAVELAEQDARNAHHPGYCTKCHSYCYGDCEAN